MVQPQDTPGSSSDVPKRSLFRNLGKKKLIYIVLPLFLLNTGVASLLGSQLALRVSAEDRQVKNESTTIPAADEVTTDEVAEEKIEDTTPPITTYTVKSGDTLSGIADKFNISINTIRWANDLTEKTSKIKPGDELVILPVSGVEYTVKKGDTLSGIAAKFDASQDDILKYNDIEKNAIKVGMSLIIPGAEPIKPKPAPAKPVSKPATPSTPTKEPTPSAPKPSESAPAPSPSSEKGYAVPISSGILTQGIHDGNAVDFGASTGTPVHAFKSGTVIVAKSSGYNGGYGSFIVVNHEGICQTQYSHLSKVSVSVGDTVTMGQQIGLSGNTGRSTGPHLHFNVRNCGGNPFAKFKKGTQF